MLIGHVDSTLNWVMYISFSGSSLDVQIVANVIVILNKSINYIMLVIFKLVNFGFQLNLPALWGRRQAFAMDAG